MSIPSQAEEAPPSWKIKGSYAEGCSCEVSCPCIFLSMPSMGKCQAVIAFHIDEGNYGPTSLKGLSLVLAVDTRPGLSMAEGNWASIVYYIDSEASSEQNEALRKIFMGMFSPMAPNCLGVKSVPISYELSGDEKDCKVSIPEVLDLQVQLVPGTDPAHKARIVNPPFHFLPELLVAKAVVNNYKDYDLEWGYPEKSGFLSHFEKSSSKASSR